ncbi:MULTISPECIES: MFS transporter [Ensifer]|jgi:MFS transporter, DHA2 family, multidrug resistance protein|uniref:MFS transporter n=1 Tax=Ensifer TaxID=106591 RepID=UPI0004AD8FC8|nr:MULTISPECIES: MFS transporter [Ensifer]MDP9630441.1 DHA2 family multidrug resistance protein-like MFS transporter [Ensifer adhaerens]
MSETMTTADNTPGPKATRREWIGLAVLALPCMLYSMDLTVLNLAVPQLTEQLKPSASQLLWIVDIYGFMVAGSLITMGTLGDRIGRRRLLMIGSIAFGIASVLAAFAWSAETLILARAVLGVAAATLAPSTLSLIRNMFLDDKQRTLAIGIWIASFSAGGAIGPVVGGLMLSQFWWGSVFLLAVPVMILLLILGPMLLPEFRDPNAGRLDFISAGQSLVAVLSVIYGMKRIAEDGLDVTAVFFILLGLTVAILFARRQSRLADPLIDLALFRTPAFSAALGVNILGLFVGFGAFLFVAQYLQLVLGLSPFVAGLWSVPTGVAMVLGSILVPSLAARYAASNLIAAGFVLTAIGFAICTQVETTSSPLLVTTGLVVLCLGFAPVGTLTTDLIVGSAPPERAGAASAISETSFEFGGALGIAVLGSMLTSAYRTRMDAVIVTGLPTETVEAARQTLGGAVAIAEQLPGEQSERLLNAARDVFTNSFAFTASICVALSLLTALLAFLLLRKATGDGADSDPAIADEAEASVKAG